jgi:glycosyltransferase involved in cell wall biosynthesis
VPNALDERICGGTDRPPRSQSTDRRKKVVGYMGTQTHDGDLMMILQPLRAMLRKHQDTVEFQLIGGIGDAAMIQAFAGLPVKSLDIGGNGEYPAFMRWMAQQVDWDLAIAPLEDNPFTRCKSDIKFLDYGILAIPAIFSRVPAYEKTVRHLETGYLAQNDNQSWQAAFELLLDDESLRRRLGTNAQKEVLSTRTLQYCAKHWREAILAIFNSRYAQVPPLMEVAK